MADRELLITVAKRRLEAIATLTGRWRVPRGAARAIVSQLGREPAMELVHVQLLDGTQGPGARCGVHLETADGRKGTLFRRHDSRWGPIRFYPGPGSLLDLKDIQREILQHLGEHDQRVRQKGGKAGVLHLTNAAYLAAARRLAKLDLLEHPPPFTFPHPLDRTFVLTAAGRAWFDQLYPTDHDR